MAKQEVNPKSFNFQQQGLMPQEEMLEVAKKQHQLVIGIPKESEKYENRIPLTPEAVEILVQNGHQVLIEPDAGKGANYVDTQFSERGGLLVVAAEVYKADILLKISSEIFSRVKAGGKVILSGLLTTDEDDVKIAYTALGFKFLQNLTLDPWLALVFTK